MGKPLRYVRGLSPTSVGPSFTAFLQDELSKIESALNFLNPYGRWDDLPGGNATSIRLTATGITPPSEESGTGLPLFSASTTNSIIHLDQLNHTWLKGSAVTPNIHWMPTDTGTGDIVWTLSWRLLPLGATWSGGWEDSESITVAADSGKHQCSTYSPIDLPAGSGESTIILWRLSRLGAVAADTYAATVRLLAFNTHYRKEKDGTVIEAHTS